MLKSFKFKKDETIKLYKDLTAHVFINFNNICKILNITGEHFLDDLNNIVYLPKITRYPIGAASIESSIFIDKNSALYFIASSNVKLSKDLYIWLLEVALPDMEYTENFLKENYSLIHLFLITCYRCKFSVEETLDFLPTFFDNVNLTVKLEPELKTTDLDLDELRLNICRKIDENNLLKQEINNKLIRKQEKQDTTKLFIIETGETYTEEKYV